jgi:hypothetical protein
MVLDLFCEFRNHTNGKPTTAGNSLLGALAYFGLDAMSVSVKESGRDLAIRGGPFSPEERERLLAYCAGDVDSLADLFHRMLPHLDIGRAMLRGRYMRAAAKVEHNGVPIDRPALELLRKYWTQIKSDLIQRVDRDYGVFEGHTFKSDKFAAWLSRNGIAWPHRPSGSLDVADETFRQMARLHPAVAPIRELRSSLSKLRLEKLAVGTDDRNRCLLSAFRTKSGRNAPSANQFVFGPSVWLRGLIKPGPGMGVAYLDWSSAEFGIAAVLSGDANMQRAYLSGDPYLAFAKMAGAAPPDATKESHHDTRELFKVCALAVQYGMRAQALADRIGKPVPYARELLQLHQQTFCRYWRWVDAIVDYGAIHRHLFTVFGWHLYLADNNTRSWINFPCQANCAEMLRLACSLATERGIRIVAPVHDALAVEGKVAELESVVAQARGAMAEASRLILSGFELRSDAKLILYPDRFSDPRGRGMWNAVWTTMAETTAGATCYVDSQVTRADLKPE